jgi:two-component system sensor histidine kinase KdpD
MRLNAKRPPAIRWTSYFLALGITGICTAAAFPFSMHVDLVNVVMVFMLGSAAAGLWLGRGPSVVAAVSNILAYDYFFVPPRFTLWVSDSSYLITFAAMLVVALIISNLMVTVRKQTKAVGARERQTAALYSMTRELAVTRDAQSMAEVAAHRIAEELHCFALVLLCAEDRQLNATPVAAGGTVLPPIDMVVAQWVASNGQRAGAGTEQYTADPAMYLPLKDAHTTTGVLVVGRERGESLLPEQQQLLEAVTGQLSSALERARLTEVANVARVAAESAAIRNTLLASISHDLRTPLSAIAGAGSMVAQNDFPLDVHRRTTLGKLIEDKARDMSDLLSNVLDLVKLESGVDILNREWHILAYIVDMAIQRNESRLTGWQVSTDVPEDLPMVSLDATLFVQLLSNLLENATKYTPPGTRIKISAVHDDATMRIAVEDNGPGWGIQEPERLFEKFSRGKVESTVGGVGLGLSICRAIARLHGGEIRPAVGREGGARFEIDLPVLIEEARLAAADTEI